MARIQWRPDRRKFDAHADAGSSRGQVAGNQKFIVAKAPVRRLHDMLRWTELFFRIGVNTRVASGQIPNTRRFPLAVLATVAYENFRSLIRKRIVQLPP